ncbi:hypothetical protein GLA29479_2388 [Lysobacter antibioticus]|uniref:Uncharacterized protein n=1 Tax=Lysobacter antibioticus TaxID=84531 RepID=A0A0S2DXK9_LYSAN|nr:hypothetical protein GLA29479_2388 [Lysobacter antibioticus]ALN81483.1 hypothetical protein LA76x_3357 [Lysobacter antibioticus]
MGSRPDSTRATASNASEGVPEALFVAMELLLKERGADVRATPDPALAKVKAVWHRARSSRHGGDDRCCDS